MSDGRTALRLWWNNNVLFISHSRGKTYLWCHLIRRRIVIERMGRGVHRA